MTDSIISDSESSEEMNSTVNSNTSKAQPSHPSRKEKNEKILRKKTKSLFEKNTKISQGMSFTSEFDEQVRASCNQLMDSIDASGAYEMESEFLETIPSVQVSFEMK